MERYSMNFNAVGEDSKGNMYMKFRKPYTPVEKIQLLERSILVNSFAYYELDENLLTDFQYDANARQLAELKKEYPEEFKRSRYHAYFHDYCSEDDGAHYTSGFDLLERVKKQDKDLYRRIWMDAAWALELKVKRGNTY
jgi:hypothetical protein